MLVPLHNDCLVALLVPLLLLMPSQASLVQHGPAHAHQHLLCACHLPPVSPWRSCYCWRHGLKCGVLHWQAAQTACDLPCALRHHAPAPQSPWALPGQTVQISALCIAANNNNNLHKCRLSGCVSCSTVLVLVLTSQQFIFRLETTQQSNLDTTEVSWIFVLWMIHLHDVDLRCVSIV